MNEKETSETNEVRIKQLKKEMKQESMDDLKHAIERKFKAQLDELGAEVVVYSQDNGRPWHIKAMDWFWYFAFFVCAVWVIVYAINKIAEYSGK